MVSLPVEAKNGVALLNTKICFLSSICGAHLFSGLEIERCSGKGAGSMLQGRGSIFIGKSIGNGSKSFLDAIAPTSARTSARALWGPKGGKVAVETIPP